MMDYGDVMYSRYCIYSAIYDHSNNASGIPIMKNQTIILLSTLLLSFTPIVNAAASGGSGGGIILLPTPDSYVKVTVDVQPGEWRQNTGLQKSSLSKVSGSAAAGNASSSASANVLQGVMSAYANAGNEPSFSQTAVTSANASFRDKLTVVNSGSSTKAVLHAELTGTITPGFGDETYDYARFDLGVVTSNGTGVKRIDGLFTANPVSFCMPVFDGYPIDCVAGAKTEYKTEIVFDLPSDGGTLQIFGSLLTLATNSAVIDFTDGYKFWLEVPENTQLQSLSGFPVTQVPEPGQYLLFLVGLIAILFRRCSIKIGL
jgi:hypothetical protein